jgi:acyl carrier protein
MFTATEIPHNFQAILRPHLPYADSGELTGADELASLGLDSMSIMQLLGDIEDNFGIELPDEILNEDTFATVGSLWSTVATLLVADTLSTRGES